MPQNTPHSNTDSPIKHKRLLQKRASRNKNQEEALYTVELSGAIASGDAPLVRDLIAKGADVNASAPAGKSRLCLAIRFNQPEIVQILREAGAEVGFVEALLLGDVELVREFLDSGSERDQPVALDNAPLHWAAICGHKEVITLLLERGADVDVLNSMGRIPLLVACLHRQNHILPLLREAGASIGTVEAALLGEREQLLQHLETGADIEARNPAGLTPLMAACLGGHVACVALLLDKGADLYAKAVRGGEMPAELATVHNHVEVLELLVQKGLDVNAPENYLGEVQKGETLLHYASTSPKSLNTLRFLLSNGADVHFKGSMKSTPLHYACITGNTEAVALLLDAGADINAKGLYGTSPVALCCSHFAKRLDVLRLLVARGAELNTEDQNGWTPLWHAVVSRDLEAMNVLIEGGVEVTGICRKNQTLLGMAVSMGYQEGVDLLKARGATGVRLRDSLSGFIGTKLHR